MVIAMHKINEKAEFSERLRQQLASKGWQTNKPTWLAKQFNSRFEGSPVSVQTANNWLSGGAIPSQEKLRVLAAWLEINAEWLRYGDAEPYTVDDSDKAYQGVPHYGLSDLPEKIEKLTPKQKRAIYDVVDSMLDTGNK
jgi:transcriptional regulator with XRE-family HTH domain